MNVLEKILAEIEDFEKIDDEQYKKYLNAINDDKEAIKFQSAYHCGVEHGIDEIKKIIRNHIKESNYD